MTTENLQGLTQKLILDAENLFGKRIGDWDFYGVEFNDRKPSLKYYIETGHITISLSHKAINDDLQLVFQLSHEICHLLHPSQEYPSLIVNKTLRINEGLSTYYSVLKTDEYFNNKKLLIDNLKNHSKKYYDAYLLVEQLLAYDADAIRNLRLKTARIDKLVETDFDALKIELPQRLKMDLISAF